MYWQKLILSSPSSLTDKISTFLEEEGALSVTFEPAQNEALFEPAPGSIPLWEQVRVCALFPAEINLQPIMASLKQTVLSDNTASHESCDCIIETVAEENWQLACQNEFPARCFANKLWICPSWDTPSISDKPCVLLDPGLAFGTGAHPTTALCLNWLATHIQQGEQVIDFGCGSGILAIAAIKLGAAEVWAVDNDPQALEATTKNAKKNHCDMSTLHILSPELLPTLKVDVIIANILANPLISLAPLFLSLLKPGGKLVLSGILENQIESVTHAYSPQVVFESPIIQEDWVCLSSVLTCSRTTH